MADETTPQGELSTEESATEAQETDWKAEARKWESRAKENHSKARAHEDAARRLAEIEESQKTEAQKAQERLEAAEKRAAELELRSIRAEVAAEKGVPIGLLTGGTKEEVEAAADALLAFRGEQQAAQVAEYSIPAAGHRPELALNGDGIEQALKNALGIR